MRFITIFTSIIFSISTAVAQTSSSNRPYFTDGATQLLYHFNETSGTTATDDSGHQRNANYNGAAIGLGSMVFFDNAFQVGAGLNNRVTWTDQGASTNSFLYPKPSSSFTIEGWFQLPTTSLNHAVTLFTVQPNNSAFPDYQLVIMPPSDPNRPLGLVFGDTTNYRAWTGPLSWDINTWYHIAIVVQQTANSATYTLYRTPQSTTPVSAIVVATMSGNLMNPIPSTSNNADRVLSIGNFYGDLGQDFFPGLIDEVRFSNVARSPSDFELTIAPTTADKIRVAATAPNSETDHALPLAGSWAEGSYPYIQSWITTDPAHYSYSPTWQLEQIASGHYLLPWFTTPSPDQIYSSPSEYSNYYATALQSAKTQNLPISFLGTWSDSNAQPQWDAYLYTRSQYLTRAPSGNPNVVLDSDGSTVVPLLSAFGATGPWSEVGQQWGQGTLLAYLQALYPSPPKILFLSNNEAKKEVWSTNSTANSCGPNNNSPCPVITDDQHYYDVGYSANDSSNTKIKNTGNQWSYRYRLLQNSWRSSLISSWQNNSQFVAYNAFGPASYGRWGDWQSYSLSYDLGTDHRIDHNPLAWDGASAQQYCGAIGQGNNGTVSDDTVWGVEIESMNFEFMRQEALQLNPNYWFELSTWNGCDNIDGNGYPTCWTGIDSSAYTAQRYAGSVQFGMWLLRPRVVRDYRGYTTPLSVTQNYFNSVMASVDKVHSNPTLQSFWRNSQLVSAEATNYTHPYQQNLLPSYSSIPRMYLLQASVNPSAPTSNWTVSTQINVFAMARMQGTMGARKWLVYVFSPNGAQTSVSVVIPGYKSIVINSNVGGLFYLVDEKQNTVTAL